mmetsp:Transcript_92048/g.265652  ORF Transcript_92048/g.265652 Transcript_92048/m.265652 type:complete len:298 (-) Transcript_92048:2240-3133(-)
MGWPVAAIAAAEGPPPRRIVVVLGGLQPVGQGGWRELAGVERDCSTQWLAHDAQHGDPELAGHGEGQYLRGVDGQCALQRRKRAPGGLHHLLGRRSESLLHGRGHLLRRGRPLFFRRACLQRRYEHAAAGPRAILSRWTPVCRGCPRLRELPRGLLLPRRSEPRAARASDPLRRGVGVAHRRRLRVRALPRGHRAERRTHLVPHLPGGGARRGAGHTRLFPLRLGQVLGLGTRAERVASPHGRGEHQRLVLRGLPQGLVSGPAGADGLQALRPRAADLRRWRTIQAGLPLPARLLSA